MKPILLSLSLLVLAVLPSCTDSVAKDEHSPGSNPENGAQFRKGEGLSLTDEMARSIGLQTAEVTEEQITATLSISLRPLPGGNEASGWLSAGEADKFQPGAVLELATSPPQKATVVRVEKPAFATASDSEITVRLEAPLAEGAEVRATLRLPEGAAVATIPPSALLSTAEGKFVYAKNGKFFVRTPVTVGATSADHVEIVEGLYSGDEIVSTPVMSLWMAELQVLRGGKACTCGH